jgi:hypothetical protein
MAEFRGNMKTGREQSNYVCDQMNLQRNEDRKLSSVISVDERYTPGTASI